MKAKILRIPLVVELLRLAVVAIGYYSCAHLCLLVSLANTNVVSLWLLSGIALALALLFGYKIGPGIFCGDFAANLIVFSQQRPPTMLSLIAVSLLIALVNTAGAFLGRWLLVRMTRTSIPFAQRHAFAGFILSAGAVSLVRSSVGIIVLYLASMVPENMHIRIWFNWLIDNFSGILVITPMLIIWYADSQLRYSLAQVLELLLTLALPVAIALLLFSDHMLFDGRQLLIYLFLPHLLWLTVRFGLREATLEIAVIAVIAIWHTTRGSGPFIGSLLSESIGLLQCFLAVIAGTIGLIGVVLQEYRTTAAELHASKVELRQIVDLVPHMIFARDRHGRFLLVNKALANAYNTTPQNLLSIPQSQIHEDQQEMRKFLADDWLLLNSGRSKLTIEERFQDANHHIRILQTTKIPFMTSASSDPAVLSVSVDITRLKQAQEQLRHYRMQLERLVDKRTSQLQKINRRLKQEIAERIKIEENLKNNQERLSETQKIARLGSWELDIATAKLTWSDETYRITGIKAKDRPVTFGEYLQCVHPEDRIALSKYIEKATSKDMPYELEVRHLQPDGSYNHTIVKAKAIREGRKVTRLLGSILDITKQKRAEQRIQYLATHDSLTGLANRVFLDSFFNKARSLADRNRQHLAILFMDLDNFKPVNDQLGHHCGDEILKTVATCIESCLRKSDIAARIGGDEFAVVLLNSDIAGASRVGNQIIAKIRQPIVINGQRCCLGVSVGICFYPQNGRSLDELLTKADMAMYQVKAQGKNSCQFFEQSVLLSALNSKDGGHKREGQA